MHHDAVRCVPQRPELSLHCIVMLHGLKKHPMDFVCVCAFEITKAEFRYSLEVTE